MRNNHKVFIKLSLILSTLPVLILAYEYGPPPGVTGAPGDKTCIQSGCHSGTPNSGPGNVRILLPSGNTGTYTPGQTMQIMVQITDSTKTAYGFQLTARSGSGSATQAGYLTPGSDGHTQVFCPDGNPPVGTACAAPFTIQDIEHTEAGWMSSIGTSGSYTYTFNWTAPASAVGTVTMYVAANCGPGEPPVQTPTNVYLSSLTLQPASTTSLTPSITNNGIVPLYSTATTIQPTSWISIYGANLATSTATWTGNFPTTLGGASVTIDGKPGYLYYASPTQINLQAPTDSATGSVPVVVTNSNGSVTSTVTLGQFGPSFSLLDGKHVAGIILRSNGAYDVVGPTGSSLGYATVAAKAGDSLVLFGVGFGATNPSVPAGQAYSGAAPTTSPVTLLINNQSISPAFSGLSSAGLYQFNLTVPTGLGTGDVPLQATVGGVTTPTGVVLSLQ